MAEWNPTRVQDQDDVDPTAIADGRVPVARDQGGGVFVHEYEVVAGGGGAPAGPAGGALDGTYPNPGLDPAVAGDGLSEAADVLSVNVDGVTIEIAADSLRVKDGGITIAKLSFDPATQTELNALAALAVLDGDAAGGVLSGTYPNPGFAVDMATQAELDAAVAGLQPLDADLTAIAALVTTAFGRNLLTLANAAALLAAAGGAAAALTLTAGSGLSGGGDLSADRTFDVNVDGSTLEINLDALRVKAGGITANEIAADAVGSSELANDAVDTNAIQNGAVTAAKVAADVATQAELDAHVNDVSAAHAASAISADSTTLVGVATDVQGVLEELDNGIADHLADATDAHDASAISIADAGNYFTGTDVEAALQELGAAGGGGGGGLFDAYAIISDTKAANTSGGNMASGAWTTHILNTEDSDPSGIVSISSNEFTLQAGSYNIVARATFVPPSNAVCDVRIRIYNVTDSAVALIGENLLLYNAGGMAHLTGRLTLAAAKALRLEYRSDAARNTDGLGLAVNWGISEVFARVEIYREA